MADVEAVDAHDGEPLGRQACAGGCGEDGDRDRVVVGGHAERSVISVAGQFPAGGGRVRPADLARKLRAALA